MSSIIDVRNLQTRFRTPSGEVKAVDGVSFHVNEHEIVGIVGESGSGKSVTQLSMMQLIPNPPGRIVGGEVWFEGKDILTYERNGKEMRAIRGAKISMIFQEPMTSLNPVLSVGSQIAESLTLHMKLSPNSARERTIELLETVGIPAARTRIDDYPHQFSGGMRQRVMIAMGLACNPKLLIADEPTTALDVTTQAVLLELMKNLVNTFNTSLILVTHNLGVVARYVDRIYVMYAGRIVETGATEDVFIRPKHPYTIGLLKSVPRLDQPKTDRLEAIRGLPPNLSRLGNGCAFLARCPVAQDQCRTRPAPELRDLGYGHAAACYRNEEATHAY